LSKDFDDEFESLLRESARVAAEYDANEEDEYSDQSLELEERHALRRVKGFQQSFKIFQTLNIANYSLKELC